MGWDQTATPPEQIDYGAADALTSVAPGHNNPTALTNVAPSHSNPTALTGTAPQTVAAPTLTSTAPNDLAAPTLTASAPGHSNPAALTNVAPAHNDPATLTNLAPGDAAAPSLTTQPPGILNPDGSTPGVPSVPSVFTPAFIELTGGGNSLSTLNANAADAAVGKILQGTVAGVLKNYQVRVGTDAQDLPGIVHPANFDAVTNAVVFVQL